MSPEAIFVLVVIGVLVAALAAYLVRVIMILHHAVDTLGKVLFGVRAIAHRTEPVTPVVKDLNANLSAVAEALEGLAARASSNLTAKGAP